MAKLLPNSETGGGREASCLRIVAPFLIILWENAYGSVQKPTVQRVMPNSETGVGNTRDGNTRDGNVSFCNLTG